MPLLWNSIIVFCLLVLILSVSSDGFNLRPNVKGKEVAIAGGVTCTFHYEAVGGTSEVWQIELDESDPKRKLYTCSVGRPDQASYLVFLSYEVQITGGSIKDVVIVDGESRPLFENEHYIVDKTANIVRPTPGFQASIQGIM